MLAMKQKGFGEANILSVAMRIGLLDFEPMDCGLSCVDC